MLDLRRSGRVISKADSYDIGRATEDSVSSYLLESGYTVSKAYNKHLPFDLTVWCGGRTWDRLQVKRMDYDPVAGAFRMPCRTRKKIPYKQTCDYMVGLWRPAPLEKTTVLILDLNEVGWDERWLTFWINHPTYNLRTVRFAYNYERIPSTWLKVQAAT